MSTLNNHVRRRGSFAPLSAHYYLDDALAQAGEAAELLYVRGLAFCAATLSDGFISDAQLSRGPGVGMSDARKRAAKLVDVGAWRRVEGGYEVRAWLDWNRSKKEILEIAEADRSRKALGGKGKPPPDDQIALLPEDSGRNPNGILRERDGRGTAQEAKSGEMLAENALRTGNTEGSVTNPRQSASDGSSQTTTTVNCEDICNSDRNPTGIRAASGTTRARSPHTHTHLPPDASLGSTSEGGSPTQRARSRTPPRPRCAQHQHLPADDPGPNCVGCRDARLAVEADLARAAQADRDAQTARAAARDTCRHCDEYGWLLDDDGAPLEPARRCDHRPLRSVS